MKYTKTQLEDDEFVKYKDCESCEGTGDDWFSCCGDDMRNNDYGICPSCKDHADYEPGNGNCQECGGTGKEEMSDNEIREEIEAILESKAEL